MPLDNLLDMKNGLANHLTALFLWLWQKNRQKKIAEVAEWNTTQQFRKILTGCEMSMRRQ